MPLDLKFDPVTQDEIDDGFGSPTMTPHSDTAVMHGLLCHYGECWQDPELGSRLHDLDYLQADPEKLGADEARRALERLESQGRIRDVEVSAQHDGVIGRLRINTRFRDASSGSRASTFVRTGG